MQTHIRGVLKHCYKKPVLLSEPPYKHSGFSALTYFKQAYSPKYLLRRPSKALPCLASSQMSPKSPVISTLFSKVPLSLTPYSCYNIANETDCITVLGGNTMAKYTGLTQNKDYIETIDSKGRTTKWMKPPKE